MFISQSTIKMYESLRMPDFAKALVELNANPELLESSIDSQLRFAGNFVDHSQKSAKRTKTRLNANLPFPCAEFEDFDWRTQPDISKSQLAQLKNCDWINERQHLVLVGSEGDEKNRLASCFGNHAIDKCFSVGYLKLLDLAYELRLKFESQELNNYMNKLNRLDVLMISQFDLKGLELEDLMLLCTLLEKRKKSLLITADVPKSNWSQHMASTNIPESVRIYLTHFTRVFNVKEHDSTTLH